MVFVVGGRYRSDDLGTFIVVATGIGICPIGTVHRILNGDRECTALVTEDDSRQLVLLPTEILSKTLRNVVFIEKYELGDGVLCNTWGWLGKITVVIRKKNDEIILDYAN